MNFWTDILKHSRAEVQRNLWKVISTLLIGNDFICKLDNILFLNLMQVPGGCVLVEHKIKLVQLTRYILSMLTVATPSSTIPPPYARCLPLLCTWFSLSLSSLVTEVVVSFVLSWSIMLISKYTIHNTHLASIRFYRKPSKKVLDNLYHLI